MIEVYVLDNYIISEVCNCDFCKKKINEGNAFYTIYTEIGDNKRSDKIMCSECAKLLSTTLKSGIDRIGINNLEVLTITKEEWDGTYLRYVDKKTVEFDEDNWDLNCKKIDI